jgi:hexosaminidase
MTFPRALALSEVAWSAKTQKNYPEFKKRVKAQLPALDQLKVNYAKSFLNQP